MNEKSINQSIIQSINRAARNADVKDDALRNDDADQPGQRAAGVGDAVSIQKKRAPRKATAANDVSKAPKAKAAGRRRT